MSESVARLEDWGHVRRLWWKWIFFFNLIDTRYELESLKIRLPNSFIIIVNYYKFTSSDSHLPEQIVLLLIWVSAVHVYPLSPKCDRHQFSPHNCHAQSIGKVLRINKMINKGTRIVQTTYWRNQNIGTLNVHELFWMLQCNLTKNDESTFFVLNIDWVFVQNWVLPYINENAKRSAASILMLHSHLPLSKCDLSNSSS